jgi:ATP-binding protein involved in chromosome partitioning
MVPREIRKLSGGAGMKLVWPDGQVNEFPAAFLRRHCRCAACQHELTGEQLLDPKSVADDLKIEKAQILGQYALGFLFSDGHSTGIYSFDWLRTLGEQPVN